MDRQTVFCALWESSSDSVAQTPFPAPPIVKMRSMGEGAAFLPSLVPPFVEVTVFTDSLSVHSYTSVKVLSLCYG